MSYLSGWYSALAKPAALEGWRVLAPARRLWAWVMAAMLAGCALGTGPDLHRLYASTTRGTGQPPVVVVPGLLGSRLYHGATGRERWPGSTARLLYSSYTDLGLPIDPATLEPRPDGIEARGITDRAAGVDYYGSILRVLEGAGQFQRAEPGMPVRPGRRYYYVFAYDWRQDNVRSAGELGRFIDRIRADHGDPDLRVDIVAHSMGGLVTRYFLRYGDVDLLDGNDFPVTMAGARRVRRVVLLGTPNLGSVETMRTLIAGRPLGLGRVPPEVMATAPSIYQLLPHAIVDWVLDDEGVPIDLDQFDIATWRRFRWGVFDPEVRARVNKRFALESEAEAYLSTLERYFEKRLERARRFLWSLTVPASDPLPLIVLGGDCTLTPARLVMERSGDDWAARLHPREVGRPTPGVDYAALMLEPGDGLVTKASLLGREALDPTVPRHRWSFFPLDYALFLCAPHDRLTANPSFQDNLLHALLSTDPRL